MCALMVCVARRTYFCCFFNDTVTTESYTYGHTLSLHDALPISAQVGFPRRARRRVAQQGEPVADRALMILRQILAHRLEITGPRSEEHTSELQSLMRNSYAVFCLKTKKRR